jgi:DNA-binding transcriptional LysR family regulator
VLLESLKLFCDAVEMQSFTRAARVGGVTQSGVSQTVFSMERRFKCRLFERKGRSVRLTPQGEVVYRAGLEIVGHYDHMVAVIQHCRGVLDGELRVTAIPSIGLGLLPAVLRRYMKEAPLVNTRLTYQGPGEVLHSISSKLADFGLMANPPKDPRFNIDVFGSDRLVLACPAGHPLAGKRKVGIKELKGVALISLLPDDPTQQLVEALLSRYRVDVRRAGELNHEASVKLAVEAGNGVAFLPESMIGGKGSDERVVGVALEEAPTRKLAIVYAHTKVLSPAMKHFMQALTTGA